jgi:hypothetical protein
VGIFIPVILEMVGILKLVILEMGVHLKVNHITNELAMGMFFVQANYLGYGWAF